MLLSAGAGWSLCGLWTCRQLEPLEKLHGIPLHLPALLWPALPTRGAG